MTENKIPTREEKLAPIIDRALSDAAFRKRLVESPKVVIAEELGVELPDELKIEVLQESSEKLYVVVPPLPAQGELNDEQLSAIAGGGRRWCPKAIGRALDEGKKKPWKWG